ncbi:pre-16S rRNA-processing nuclease YqgF [Candidatus Microgenomates bacterium]|nr:pre-16S rRNA-processing nuclease YqgF [Candidatus Microgenomates bacterium]
MILGIDYGEKWCGLATSEGSLAEPLNTVNLANIFEEVERLKPEKIVVGISEKNMAKKTLVFVEKLKVWTKVPVETIDETLTSVEASNIKSKDKQKQHAIAAALILQRYLDSM